jgi:transcriptional regulator with XRE-family HTH domain
MIPNWLFSSSGKFLFLQTRAAYAVLGGTMPSQLNLEMLGERLREIRKARGKTLQDVFHDTKVSVPTLSRIERGEANDIGSETLAPLADWMNLTIDTFYLTPTRSTPKSTPDVVELHLRADKKLNPKTARALSRTFRLMYEQLSRDMKGK